MNNCRFTLQVRFLPSRAHSYCSLRRRRLLPRPPLTLRCAMPVSRRMRATPALRFCAAFFFSVRRMRRCAAASGSSAACSHCPDDIDSMRYACFDEVIVLAAQQRYMVQWSHATHTEEASAAAQAAAAAEGSRSNRNLRTTPQLQRARTCNASLCRRSCLRPVTAVRAAANAAAYASAPTCALITAPASLAHCATCTLPQS